MIDVSYVAKISAKLKVKGRKTPRSAQINVSERSSAYDNIRF